MREAILILIVAGLCITALFRPFIGLLGYFWFALMRPDILAFAYGTHPLSLSLAIAVLLASVRFWNRLGAIVQSPFGVALVLLQILLLPSVFFAVDPALSIPPYLEYLRIVLMPLLIPVLVHSLDEFRKLLLVTCLSLGAIGVKFGVGALAGGGAFYREGYGGMLTDNNDLGLAFVMTVVMCWYARSIVSTRWMKILLLFVAFSTAAGAVMTHSRGAALSMAAGFVLIILRAKQKLRITALLLILVGPSIYLVRDSYTKRMSTVGTYQEDESAMGRIRNAKAGFAMWKDYPLFGVGFGKTNFAALSEQYGGEPGLVAHNTYVQTLADDGILAFLTYVSLLCGAITWLGFSARKIKRKHQDLAAYPLMIQTALVVFLVGSAFLSRLQFDLLYILLMAAGVWYRLEKQYLAESPFPSKFGARIHQDDLGECLEIREA